MAQKNYSFEKRQKDLAKKKKQEEKRQKKLTKNTGDTQESNVDATETSDASGSEAPSEVIPDSVEKEQSES